MTDDAQRSATEQQRPAVHRRPTAQGTVATVPPGGQPERRRVGVGGCLLPDLEHLLAETKIWRLHTYFPPPPASARTPHRCHHPPPHRASLPP
eukprot:CAMPEP_0173384336 /NCGR_PEP_ID=MMETSP1356-20130122/6917_1 /TAXON_ID=77927 ORGANISM="Hemiselmis virescens, Strain PCC157" /NCGR_SAMPLE_ID=MMETSP1356 /ASSEMBLY_ACC=CAM_ASM_000847 /LENGTH=92 /DNA_ID=CAMNT_0014339637 /DNA_START=153 /DNA_END=428 /DNA_ORIENTATION=-